MIFLLLALAVQGSVDWAALRQDIVDILPGCNSPTYCEPFKHNGPFFVRLAWHCAGTYRAKDGRGGCDGGRITMMPENGWRDNAGLPDAIALLRGIKDKYGDDLSWGDLIVFTGSTAIEEMEGPKIKFCGGRDNISPEVAKAESDRFNLYRPNKHHDLIYVDPGQDGAAEVRETFGDMGFNDQETVAISGGGHAFGGCHAARSGFNGYWTRTPAKFTNDYFVQLIETEYEAYTVPETGNPQYMDKATGELMMLKTDIAFSTDPIYREWVHIYAQDFDRLLYDFGKAWEKLMNRDMGDKPCQGPDYPAPKKLAAPAADLDALKESLAAIPEVEMGLAVDLAHKCATTFRKTDYRGGCNGARIRFEPELAWESNSFVPKALDVLEPFKQAFPAVSWADLIVLAGTVGAERYAGADVPFCAGREDDADGAKSELLLDGHFDDDLVDYYEMMGLSVAEAKALNMGVSAVGGATAKTLGGGANPSKQEFVSAWTKVMNSDLYQECSPVTFSKSKGEL